MKISQLSDNKVMISLSLDDMESFELKFSEMGLSNPHAKKIIKRLLSLASISCGITNHNHKILCEALESTDGCILLVSYNEEKKRKKYRIKRISEYPCFKFSSLDNLLCAIKTLYNSDIFFYNNCVYMNENDYFLVFDYPVLSQKAANILLEFSKKVRGTKPFVARLYESAKPICKGNAILHIGASL